mgnify:CR=1 FL=1
MSNGALQLLGADGAVLATLVSQPTSLAGTSWRATGINNGKGGVASLPDRTEGRFDLRFEPGESGVTHLLGTRRPDG